MRFFKFNSKSIKSKFKININGTSDKINDPTVPDIVLLGLIFDNFLPPIILPNV
jgi:hypothetical protein